MVLTSAWKWARRINVNYRKPDAFHLIIAQHNGDFCEPASDGRQFIRWVNFKREEVGKLEVTLFFTNFSYRYWKFGWGNLLISTFSVKRKIISSILPISVSLLSNRLQFVTREMQSNRLLLLSYVSPVWFTKEIIEWVNKWWICFQRQYLDRISLLTETLCVTSEGNFSSYPLLPSFRF